MEFQIGKVVIRAHRSGKLIIVAPIGDYMIATKIETFELIGSPNSMSADIQVYKNDDAYVVERVQRWLKECEEKH